MTFPFQNCARAPSLFVAVSEVKMSRQTTLGRFGFKKSISHRNSVMETKVPDFVSTMSWTIVGQFFRSEKGIILYGYVKNIKLYCIYRCFNTQNYIYPFQNLSLGFILKIFLKFRKFQPRYSYKIYSYRKKRVQLNATCQVT